MSTSYKYPHSHSHYDTTSPLDRLFAPNKGAWVALGIAAIYLAYTLALPSTLAALSWNALVSLTPSALVLAVDKRRNPNLYDPPAATGTPRNSHAYKSEAMWRIFSFASAATLPGANSLRRASWLGGLTSSSNAPPGLGNWDNSCYQNSVLQGLSAFQSLSTFLEQSDPADSSTTVGSLRELTAKLNDHSYNGCRVWTPAKLKSMSSWQQQDAQEYFSKIMDDMEKDMATILKPAPGTAGLREVGSLDTVKASDSEEENNISTLDAADAHKRNPLDGFLAQRVACTSCGFSEGLSMIPFNCITVPLGKSYSYNIEDCLNEYTSLEEISGVECARCTLLRTKTQLQNMTADSQSENLPPPLRAMVDQRIQAVDQALEEGDVSDDTLNKKCQITKKARVLSTKTRQAVVARAPQCLVIHVNRSVFDEYTGDQSKNLAQVAYPKTLNLGPWCLGATQDAKDQEEWRMDPSKSMIGSLNNDSRLQYTLRAAVTHYGRHENGHYICYREHAEHVQTPESDTSSTPAPSNWWRLSDDDVSAVSEEHVLGQGGVFMLFYERVDSLAPEDATETVAKTSDEESTNSTTVEVPREDHDERAELAEEAHISVTQEEAQSSPAAEVSEAPVPQAEIRKVSTPPMMRTAGNKSKRRKSGFSATLQQVAAT